jgi:hypothetical protein
MAIGIGVRNATVTRASAFFEMALHSPQKRTASARKAARSTRLRSIAGSTIDDHRPVVAIVIPVTIMTLPDHDGIVATPAVALANNLAVALPITITMAVSDGHADRADTNSDLFRASRHSDANCSRRDGHHYKTFHHSLLSL